MFCQKITSHPSLATYYSSTTSHMLSYNSEDTS